MKKYFVTGTDTDCGKTYTVCQLLDWLHRQGHKAHALKPVASGLVSINNELVNDDIEQLTQHTFFPFESINKWLYDLPVSPHLAAKKSGEQLSVFDINQFCNSITTGDYQLIEGAGGLLVPLNDNETWLDFVTKTKIPVILVVGIRLGCINHALLTDYVLKSNKIQCVGWIANCLDEETLLIEEIISTLKYKMHMPFLTKLKYCGIIEEITLWP